MPKPRICFVALQAYNVLSDDSGASHVGGAEVQQVQLGRMLASRGYDVSFVTLDHGQTDGETAGGITVYKSYRREAGIPGVRFVHPRMTSVWAAMRRADADVYYQRTSDSTTGVVAAFCRRHGRKFIFSLGAMADCDPALPNCPSRRERYPFLYGLRRADAVIAQSNVQQDQLRAHFGVDSVVIRSTGADPGSALPPEDRTVRPSFLWIGRFVWEKRPELLFELAERCPEANFVVVGGAPEHRLVQDARAKGLTLRNVEFKGYVPYRDVSDYYKGAAALISTSVIEGFPNTFIEAWSRGIPTLTSVDPDGVVVRNKLGIVASDLDSFVAGVRQISQAGTAERQAWSSRCRTYYLQNHHPDIVVAGYEAVLARLCGQHDRATQEQLATP